MFQQIVNRSYTTGFPGEIVRDGPHRAKLARIASANSGVNTNRISRAFGWASDAGTVGSGASLTEAALSANVTVGGPIFYGILFHPKHYALQGTVPNGLTGGSLAPSLDLPLGSEGEFTDMATGLVVEVYNFTTAAQTIAFGDQVCYVSSAITTGQNALTVPYGAIVIVAAGATPAAGLVLIPNARVINAINLAASAVGALVSGYTIVQLTQ